MVDRGVFGEWYEELKRNRKTGKKGPSLLISIDSFSATVKILISRMSVVSGEFEIMHPTVDSKNTQCNPVFFMLHFC